MAELLSTSRLLHTIFGGILFQLFSVSATLNTLNDVTWDKAFYTCHQYGEQLYSTSDITSLSDVTEGSYWIGAKVQYSSWMWTADNTPLFGYIGEVNEFTSVQFSQIKYDNQASRCYYECQQHKNTASVMYVGLQGEKCYCFKWLSSFPGLFQRENKNICLGNFNENCGTENTMSIYKIGLPSSWFLDVGGLCGYIEYPRHNVKTEENCNLQKAFICNCIGHYNSSSCYHHEMKNSWTSSNSVCSLTKLTSNNINIILSNWWADKYQYWIGLKRNKQLIQSDNFEAFSIKINITQNGCVLLEKSSNGKNSFSISNCSDVHSAICVNSADVTKSPIVNEDKKDQTGVAVGVSVTLILLVAVAVVVTVWMKRSHKFCFKTKPESSMTRQARSVNQQNLSDYDEIKPGTDSNYEFETLTNVTMVTKPNSSDYELATDVNAANVKTNSSDYELASDVNAAAGQTNNSYNNNTDEDDYNVLNDSHINNNNYNHTEITIEGDYDTADSKPKSMSAHDKTYNHIGDVMEGDYDTTAPKTTSSHDETYNHIAAVTEDDYNIADMDLKNADCTSDDYNHLDSVRG